jgi:hypothetical protein
MTAPGPVPPATKGAFEIHPFLWVAGGVKGDLEVNRPGTDDKNRLSALSLVDLGFRGSYSDWLTFESEIMANGGFDMHGSSVFEGQASLQVRKQLIHIEKGIWMAEVGRIIDEASVDYFSEHVADLFMEDTATRDPLLYSGFNLGNGLRGTVQVAKGLRLGLTFNAGNIVSTSQTLVVGGTFSPFARIYLEAFGSIANSPQRYPDDTLQTVVLSPAILYDSPHVSFRVEAQGFQVQTSTTTVAGTALNGVNSRATIRLSFLDDVIAPFANFSYDYNDVIDPASPTAVSINKYEGYVAGGGIDFNYQRKYGHNNGVGLQYEQVENSSGPMTQDIVRYANIGTTYWLAPILAAGARIAYYGDETYGLKAQGEVSGILTLRLVL